MAELYGMVWTRWRSVKPPPRTVVIGRYGDTDPKRVKTCAHGCCVTAGYGSMVLPDWWAPTDDQASPLGYFQVPTPGNPNG